MDISIIAKPANDRISAISGKSRNGTDRMNFSPVEKAQCVPAGDPGTGDIGCFLIDKLQLAAPVSLPVAAETERIGSTALIPAAFINMAGQKITRSVEAGLRVGSGQACLSDDLAAECQKCVAVQVLREYC